MKKAFVLYLTFVLMLSTFLPVLSGAENNETVNDVTICGFETPDGYSAIYTANHVWQAGGYAGSDGALKISQGTNKMSGVAINGINTVVGTTYDISIIVKPPQDNPNALDKCHVVVYHSWYDKGDNGEMVISPQLSGYHEMALPVKTDMGGGWYQYSVKYTVSETCNVWSSGAVSVHNVYGTASKLEFRGQTTDVEYMVDDFICVPAALNEETTEGDHSVLIDIDFENGLEGMTGADCTVSLSPTGGVGGSAHLKAAAAGTMGGVKYDGLTIEPDRVYKLSWWAKADNETALNKYLTGYFFFSGGFGWTEDYHVRENSKLFMNNEDGENPTLTYDWQYFECYYKTQNSAYVAGETLSAYFFTRLFTTPTGANNGEGCEFSIDDIKLEKFAAPFNGAFDLPHTFETSWNSPVTYYPTWLVGENTTASYNFVENPYLTVTQFANSAGGEDTDTRVLKQYVPRKANTEYKLTFRAKSETEDINLVPLYTSFDAENGAVTEKLTLSSGGYPKLSTEWQSYNFIFTTDKKISNAVLGFSAELGGNTASLSYDIDNIALVEQAPVIDAVPLSGEVKNGGVISAGAVPRIDGTNILYRILCSRDNVNYATLKYGFLTEKTIDYLLTENDSGRYIKMEFIGICGDTVTNKIVTEPVFFGGSFVNFTSDIYSDELSAQGTIMDESLLGMEVLAIIAMYDVEGALLGTYQNKQYTDTIQNGRINVSGSRLSGTCRAKAFLWKGDGTLTPLAQTKEISQMKRNKNVMVNIAADGLESAVIRSTSSEPEEYVKNTKEYISNYLQNAPVGRMLFNVCYSRSVVDSDAIDSMLYNVETNSDGTAKRDENGNVIKTVAPVCESTSMLSKYRAMIERGIDVVDMAIDATHDFGAEAWVSVRMNDHHYPNDPGFNSSFRYNRAAEVGVNGSRGSMDYTKKAAQNYFKSYIIELCEKYDIDGIEFDYLRSCPIMSTADEAGRQELNRYIKELRETVNAIAKSRGKEIKISARIYPEEQMNINYGVDAAQWIADGSVDVLTVEGWYIPTYYHIPVQEWRSSINAKNTENHPYSLLCGTDWAVRCDSRAKEGYIMWITLEQFKGFASAVYEKGADGVYFFNHFAPNSDSGGSTYYIDKNGVKTRKSILTEKLKFAASQKEAETGMRAYVNTCRDYSNTLYPIALSDSFSFVINTGSRPESGYYTVLVGIDAMEGFEENLLTVTVNGASATQIGDVPHVPGFIWSASTSSEPAASHVSETAPRVMQFMVDDLSVIRDGENTVTITNPSGKTQSIKWLEIQVDSTIGAVPLEMAN